MHLPLTLSRVNYLRDPPWSSFRIIAERNVHKQAHEETQQKYDLVLLDSKQFAVQTFTDKAQKIYHHFDALNILKDDVVHIFSSNDKNQPSTGNIGIYLF